MIERENDFLVGFVNGLCLATFGWAVVIALVRVWL